jgi:hypothetical protein
MNKNMETKIKKEQLRLALTELVLDAIRLQRGDDSGVLINTYTERIFKLFKKV